MEPEDKMADKPRANDMVRVTMKCTSESLLPLSANEKMSVNKPFLTHCAVGIKVFTSYGDCQSFAHLISIAFFVPKSWVTVLPTGRMNPAGESLYE